MKNFLILLCLFIVACSNDNNIVQRLAQEPAIVREVKGTNNLFVLYLQNANSSLCSSYIVPYTTLPADYKKDGLPVLISGDVTSNFVAVDGYISESEGNTIPINGKYNMIALTTVAENDLSLKNTKWKLVGIVDNETSVLTELKPTDCKECYTLVFDVDSVYNDVTRFNGKIYVEQGWYKIFTGKSTSNFISCLYRADYKGYTFQIYNIGGTEICEVLDGDLYRIILYDVQSFALRENELKLYYNGKTKYLLFKPYKS